MLVLNSIGAFLGALAVFLFYGVVFNEWRWEIAVGAFVAGVSYGMAYDLLTMKVVDWFNRPPKDEVFRG